jgi:hypothetical protein
MHPHAAQFNPQNVLSPAADAVDGIGVQRH